VPTPTTAKLPRPKSEDEFEDIVRDALTVRWGTPNVHRHGRRGQRQHGIDLYAQPPHLLGGWAAAQCKNVLRLAARAVVEEVSLAIHFQPPISEFLIVTAADRDANVQEQVRQHFANCPAPFDVHILFWNDVTDAIAQRRDLVAKHWKGFVPSASPDSNAKDLAGQIALPVWRWAASIQAVTLDWNGRPLWPIALLDDHVKIPTLDLSNPFRWEYRHKPAVDPSTMPQFEDDPLLCQAQACFPQSFAVIEPLCLVVQTLGAAVIRQIDATAEQLKHDLSRIEDNGAADVPWLRRALAFAVLDYRWGSPKSYNHYCTSTEVRLCGGTTVYQGPKATEVARVIADHAFKYEHGIVPQDVVVARGDVARIARDAADRLAYPARLGVDSRCLE